MTRIDRILDLLDGTGQDTTDTGFGTDHAPGLCARCQRHQPVDDTSDLCTGCRSFLLEDTDDDPARSLRGSLERYIDQRLQDDFERAFGLTIADLGNGGDLTGLSALEREADRTHVEVIQITIPASLQALSEAARHAMDVISAGMAQIGAAFAEVVPTILDIGKILADLDRDIATHRAPRHGPTVPLQRRPHHVTDLRTTQAPRRRPAPHWRAR